MKLALIFAAALLSTGQMAANDPPKASKAPGSMPATRPADARYVATCLKDVTMGLAVYASEHNDRLPADLGELLISGAMKEGHPERETAFRDRQGCSGVTRSPFPFLSSIHPRAQKQY